MSRPTQAQPPDSPPSEIRSVQVLGVRVDCVTFQQALDLITSWAAESRPRMIATINPEFIMRAGADPQFAAVLAGADLCIPDGWGVLWAGRRAGGDLRERVTGIDLLPPLAAACAQRAWPLFLLGAGPGVGDRAAANLRANSPGLEVVDHAGSADPEGDQAALELIAAAAPRILAVAFGAPKQELWIARNQPRLGVPVAIGVGGALDFIAGDIARAPAWMGAAGLEWMFRLFLQPWRIRRMLALPRFATRVLRHH